MASKRFSVDAVFRGINKISKPVRSMGRAILKFAKKSNRQIAKLGAKFKKLGSFMGKAIIGGAGIAAVAIGAAVMKTAELGDEAAKTSRRLGITAEALQELRFAADRQGVSASVLSSSFTALQKRVGELKSGTGSLYAFLKKTGDKAFIRQLSLAKNTEEAFEMITKKAATIKDPMEKAAFASAAFSRAGVDMLKFMEAGTDGIAKLRKEARKYGAVISNEAAAKSELFVDAMTNFKSVIGGVGLTLGTKLMPFLTNLIQGFADFWSGNRKLISQGIDRFISMIGNAVKTVSPFFATLFDVSKQLFNAFMQAVSSILPQFSVEVPKLSSVVQILMEGLKILAVIGLKAFEFITFMSPFLKPFIATLLIFKGVLIAIAIATKAWGVVQGIVNAVMAANPLTLIMIAIAAVVAGIVLLVQNWDTVVAAFKKGIDSIKKWFNDLLNSPFITGIAKIFSNIWSIFSTGFDEAMKSVENIINKIKNIPGVKSIIDFFTGGDSEAETKPVSPQERLSRTIEERQHNSTLTINDKTGSAVLSPQKRGGPQIALATSGGL